MTYSEAEKNILELDLPSKIVSIMLTILDDFKNDFEPEQCIVCCGSGEGKFDGSTCQICKGKGEIIESIDDRDYDIQDQP